MKLMLEAVQSFMTRC